MEKFKFRAWHKKLKCWGKPCVGIDFDKLEAIFGLGVRYLYFHNKEIDELPTAISSEKVDILNAQDKIVIMQYTDVKEKVEMKELKFRAIIPERNAIIYFTLKDLIEDKFSNREILWKWLEEGNQPDLFTGFKDKNTKEIYEGDIVRCNDEYCAVVIWKRDGFILDFFGSVKSVPSLWYNAENSEKIEVVGNIYENPELTILLSDDV